MDSIIFDVDGTLWDPTETVAKAWNDVISEHSDRKPDLTAATLKSLFGRTLPDIAKVVFCDYPAAMQQHLIALCCTREHEAILQNGATLYADLRLTLKILAKKNPLFLVSNCQSGYIEVFLEYTQLGDYFKDYLCAGDTGRPKADNIRTIITRHQLNNSVYIGDTDGDERAAREAGLPFVYASYGFGQTVRPDYTISGLIDLVRLFS